MPDGRWRTAVQPAVGHPHRRARPVPVPGAPRGGVGGFYGRGGGFGRGGGTARRGPAVGVALGGREVPGGRSSPSRRSCGTQTDTTSPEGPACAKTSGSAGAVDDSGVVGSVWPCDVAQRSCAHSPVPGAGATAARGGRFAAPPLVADAEPSGACPCSAASARHVATCAAVADRSVRVVWARPAAHRRALTRWCAARGGEAVWCAGRRCRLGGAACHAASPVRAAPDTRPTGPRPRAVPVR